MGCFHHNKSFYIQQQIICALVLVAVLFCWSCCCWSCSCLALQSTRTGTGTIIHYRTATSIDVTIAKKILFQQAMNPLSIKAENMIVAYTVENCNTVNNNNNPPLLSFGNDYNDIDVVGFGQLRLLSSSSFESYDYYELASLYVDPLYRRMGIASNIIQQLLERLNNNNNNRPTKICLLTLKPTAPLYEHHGFQQITDTATLPKEIQLEAVAGSFISKLLGNQLICMTRVL